MAYPTTRAQAVAEGATHYYTGLPCKRGHIALRETKGNCTECRKEDDVASREKRKAYFDAYNKSEKGKANKRKHYEEHKQDYIMRAALRNPDAKSMYKKAHKERNPEYYKLLVNTRRRRLRDCTPKWLTKEQKDEVKQVYDMALQLTKSTGVRYTVDHIVPINGADVCGLHVPWNLQVMPHVENARKGNRM